MKKSRGLIVLAGLLLSFPLQTLPARAESLSEVAERIGADTFYDLGYTGVNALLGNIEAGMTWDGHDTLDDGRVLQQYNPFSLPGDNTENHATLVGGAMVCEATAGGGPGIANSSPLWTSDIATGFGSGGSFSISGNSLLYPLMVFGEVGINASGEVGGPGSETTDVINSSWGGSDDTGNSIINVIYDYLANSAGVTMVAAAGNAGQGEGKVGTPANGWNVIAVGATGGTDDIETVTSWSSGGPSGSFNLPGTRTKPDLVAPGLSISMPQYNLGDPSAFQSASGTSFASPVVAGAAGLLIDFGTDTGRSTDPRLVKSVLLNSATKLTGWSQETGVHPVTGTLINLTPVDGSQGAGRVNLADAYELYSASTNDTAPGPVGTIGWDVNTVSEGAARDYVMDTMLPADSTLSATLIWFMDRSVSGFDPDNSNPFPGTSFANDSFDDLDLELYLTDESGSPVGDAVAASVSGWGPLNPDDPATGLDSVEHIYFALPSDGRYLLRVRWTQELFDYVSDDNTEDFALSWSVDALTPGDGSADRLVDGEDLGIWQQYYDPLGLNENTFSMGDWNFDGVIDGVDLALWQ